MGIKLHIHLITNKKYFKAGIKGEDRVRLDKLTNERYDKKK